MAYVQVQTRAGMRQVRVCDNCRTVVTQTRFCSRYCKRAWEKREKAKAKR